MKRSRKGFTLAELLVVVAIIAVLVAIAIPVFSGQLEKAREATDAANIRAKYAEGMTELLANGNSTFTADVAATQKTAGWQSDISKIGGMNVDASTVGWTIAVNSTKDGLTITAK